MGKCLELLAPAQNKECAIEAINYGADSVYIGANLYGARKNAGNSLEDIEDIVNYAHKFGVKIYVTLNTILDDEELKNAVELIKKLHKIKVDGVIIQDFGILNEAFCGSLPDIKLIASTQCDIRTKEKVKFFEKLGIKRVILARELSLKQIKEISDSLDPKAGVEIETFIHGALCVSYSGQCYLSYKIGGRSANRGECAQACRKKYSLVDNKGKVIVKDKYLLSMKDFMAAKRLEELIDSGVTSFKIEGRLKDVYYIKNTVLYYRRLLDKIIERRQNEGFKKLSSGKIRFDFEPCPNKSFNRDFCEYFLDGRKPLNREKIFNFDVPNSKGEYLGKVKNIKEEGKNGRFSLDKPAQIQAQDGLCFVNEQGELKGFLVNSYKEGWIFPNIMPEIQAGVKIYRNKDAGFENLLKSSKTKRQIGVKISVDQGFIEATDEDNNKISADFSGEEAKNPDKSREALISAFKKTGESDFYIEKIDVLSEPVPFLPISKLNEMRRNVFEKLMEKRVENYKTEKQKPLKTAKYPADSGDYRLNVHNKKAEEFYQKCGCKVEEYSLESGISSAGKELMRTKHCIRFALNMCLKTNIKKCDEGKTPANQSLELFLTDEKGEKYRLCFDCKNCEMIIKSL